MNNLVLDVPWSIEPTNAAMLKGVVLFTSPFPRNLWTVLWFGFCLNTQLLMTPPTTHRKYPPLKIALGVQ